MKYIIIIYKKVCRFEFWGTSKLVDACILNFNDYIEIHFLILINPLETIFDNVKKFPKETSIKINLF